ncbi:MAG: NAD(P) transhydrogenase subunit alpha [Bacilli bacterium]|jgi:NAD(P) transhydrogenase subunit alpha|nr:NAD(P) transhydrogenase subunit alpha [Bacilli bacterium]
MEIILVAVFLVSTILGYILINNVPSLLHTPLMSGMNALSGITIVGALIATAIVFKGTNGIVSSLFGGLAIIVASINVFGGFGVTDRMLKMFKKKEKRVESHD